MDGSTRLILGNNTSWSFKAVVIAQNIANNDTASYVIEGVIRRGANEAATAILGTPIITTLYEDVAGWDFGVSADTTNGSLKLLATGAAASTINWVAHVSVNDSTDEIVQFNTDGTISFTVTGASIEAGEKKTVLSIPFAATILSWDIAADVSGSVVVDIWKRNADIPTVAHTITAASKPTLSSQRLVQGGSVSGWTTAIAANDVMIINVVHFHDNIIHTGAKDKENLMDFIDKVPESTIRTNKWYIRNAGCKGFGSLANLQSRKNNGN